MQKSPFRGSQKIRLLRAKHPAFVFLFQSGTFALPQGKNKPAKHQQTYKEWNANREHQDGKREKDLKNTKRLKGGDIFFNQSRKELGKMFHVIHYHTFCIVYTRATEGDFFFHNRYFFKLMRQRNTLFVTEYVTTSFLVLNLSSYFEDRE